jgi:hypothetical protein
MLAVVCHTTSAMYRWFRAVLCWPSCATPRALCVDGSGLFHAGRRVPHRERHVYMVQAGRRVCHVKKGYYLTNPSYITWSFLSVRHFNLNHCHFQLTMIKISQISASGPRVPVYMTWTNSRQEKNRLEASAKLLTRGSKTTTSVTQAGEGEQQPEKNDYIEVPDKSDVEGIEDEHKDEQLSVNYGEKDARTITVVYQAQGIVSDA